MNIAKKRPESKEVPTGTRKILGLLRLFERRARDETLQEALATLRQEKSTGFRDTNHFLEKVTLNAPDVLEMLRATQHQMERESDLAKIEALHEIASQNTTETIRKLTKAKGNLEGWKVVLSRFIYHMENGGASTTKTFSLDEWMDQASLAEIRLKKESSSRDGGNFQQFVALFSTFRSIICSYEGPAQFIRQIEAAQASLTTLYDTKMLKLEAQKASQRLMQTSRELDTVRLDLRAAHSELVRQKRQAVQREEILAKRESRLPLILFLTISSIAIAGTLFFVMRKPDTEPPKQNSLQYQNSCLEVYQNLAEIRGYNQQILIFRKFSKDIYFFANHLTCEKLHKLDSIQVWAVADLLEKDFATNPPADDDGSEFPVLEVKDIGINKLTIKLRNSTEENMDFKLAVLELANTMHALLVPAKSSEESDLLVLDLNLRKTKPQYK